MNDSERRSTRVVVCLLFGRLAAALGLMVCLTHFLFHHPPMLWRAAAGTAVGVALLGEAASLVDDRRLFADELVRALSLAALCILCVVARVYYRRVPRFAEAREKVAAAACSAILVGGMLRLWRRDDEQAPERENDEA